MSVQEAIWELKKGYVSDVLKRKERLDGRGFDDYRPIKIETGLFHHAEGSARVTLGKTEVLAGIKLEVEKPYPDTPDEGSIAVNMELNPMASPSFEAGPPSQEAVELARVVDRGIRESHIVDLEKLCITPGEKMWTVFADVIIVNYDGNLFDASTLAVLAALHTAKMPKYEDDKIVRGEWAGKVPVKGFSTLSTFAKVNDSVILDPSLDEDKSLDARISVSVTDDDSICALQKGGLGAFSFQETEDVVTDRALKAAKQLRKDLRAQVKMD